MFKKKKKLNKKAFTMVELLGVMVIVGVISTIAIVSVSRYFNQSREEKERQNKNNVVMAAEAYFQANRDLLPKNLGETSKVDLNDLRKAKYLSADVSNSKEESCMEHSYVRVVKLDDDYYSYVPQLYCGSETPKASDEDVDSPVVLDFSFFDTDEKPKDEKLSLTNVKNARFAFTMKGSATDDNVKIYNYSYSIHIKDDSTAQLSTEGDGFIEVFNSGVIRGNDKHEIAIKSKPLSKYVDVTGKIEVKVKVTVMNDQGAYYDFVSGSSEDGNGGSNAFEDTVAPLCGNISGDALNDDEWTNKATYESGMTNNKRLRGYPTVLTVLCDDGNGSGCKRRDFSKSWPTSSGNELGKADYNYGARWGYVIIEDNAVNANTALDCSKNDNQKFKVFEDKDDKKNNVIKYCDDKNKGNQRVCFVRVNVDVKAPSINVEVYKEGTKTKVAGIKVEDSGPTNTKNPEGTIKSTDYVDAVGATENEKWLNLKNYPNGIELKVDVEDNLYAYRWTWETSDAYMPFATSDSDLVSSAVESGKGENNAILDGSASSSGIFTEEGVNKDIVTNMTQFKANEQGVTHGTITGIKLTLEGKRYGRLTVYDKAENPTILHVYANIDRTPPEIPTMSHTKIGHTKAKDDQVTYTATNSSYIAGKENNYTDNNNWSREEIRTYIEDAQKVDKKATISSSYSKAEAGNKKDLDGDLSGWWKFKYEYQLQDPKQKRYTWKETVKKEIKENDAKQALEFKDEGTHKVRVVSCDKANNCSDISKDDFIKIDYTLPTCDFKETFTGVSGCTESLTCFSGNCTTSKTCYNKYGWLKENQTVTLSHVCSEDNKNISSNCNESSSLNRQKYLYNFDIEVIDENNGKKGAGANGFGAYVETENFEGFDVGVSPAPKTSIGGHVIDYAGNIRECGTKTVKIDYIKPNCSTKISYGVDGREDTSIHPKRPENPSNPETGWLSLYKGGKDGIQGKETATVAHACEDPLSTGPRMRDVHSDCDPDTLKHTVYNWELRTTVAGALGIGQGGEIADKAGNIAQCPADRTINIDYTQPKCDTIIEYPQGSPINQTGNDIESGWLGFNDNVHCKNGQIDMSYRNGDIRTANNFSGVTGGSTSNQVNANTSNIKGEGNVPTTVHKAYLSGKSGSGTISRGEYARALCDAIGIDYSNVTYSKRYSDVTESTANWKPILAATYANIFAGTASDKFSPTSNLRRAELVASVMRAVAYKGVTSTTSCVGVAFSDYPADAWYANDLRAAANNCYFNGTAYNAADELYVSSATKDATVAQVATVIYRAFRSKDENNCVTTANKKFDVKTFSSSASTNWERESSEALADATTEHTCSEGVQASSVLEAGDDKTFGAYLDKNTLNASSTLTRQEFVKLLYDAAQITPTNTFRSVYSDVTNSNPYWRYIVDAYNNNIMVGTGSGKFSPTGSITRAQIITAMMRFMEKYNLSTGKTCSPQIPDVEEGKWYAADMKKAASMCLLVGDNNGFFMPDNIATISETTAILFRAFRDEKGLKCTVTDKNGNEVDYDTYMPTIPGVPATSWQYEYLKNATTDHTCSGSIGDPLVTANTTYGNVPDTSCDELYSEKKTAVITQICSEKDNRETQSGCYGSLTDSGGEQNSYRTKTYDQTIDTTQACAVGVGNCGYIVDVAGNITNCNGPENFHTVRIDYERPSCRVDTKYNDRRISKSGNYDDGHWMGKNSSATISSLCNNDAGGSGCWTDKDTTFTYSQEIKAVNVATSKPDLKEAYVYDLAGNRSAQACPKKTVQIDHTGPVCKTMARYYKGTVPSDNPNNDTQADSVTTGEYKPDKTHTAISQYYTTGWINGYDYSVRVISYCEKDDAKNVKAGGSNGSECKDHAKTPNGNKNQRSTNVYKAQSGTVLNEAKGAKGTAAAKTDSTDFYEHTAYNMSGAKRITLAKVILDALGIKPESGSTPFTDISGLSAEDQKVVATVYSNNLMVGTSPNSFSPNSNLTRAQLVTVIVRASQNLGISHSQSCTKATFTDYNRSSTDWYAPYVNYAIDNCILVGFGDGKLAPESVPSAAQVHTVIDRALRFHEEGYKCSPDQVSIRKDSPWDWNGEKEKVYHKCTRQEAATNAGAKHVIYDEVGNKTTCGDIKLMLDAQKPKCDVAESNITYDNGTKWTKENTIRVTKSCNDNSGSGCHDGIDTLTSNSKCNTQLDYKDYNYTGSDYTTWTGYACSTKSSSSGMVVDNVGNTDSCAAHSIGIDHAKPTCDITDNGHNGNFTRSMVTISGLCTDRGSGCVTTKQDINWYSGDYNSSQSNSWTAQDNVGNTKDCTKSHTIRIDNTAPEGNCAVNGTVNGAGYYNITYSTGTGIRDNVSGVTGVGGVTAKYGYINDDSCFTNTNRTVAGYAQLCDSLGNCSYDKQCTGNVTIYSCCSSTYRSCDGEITYGNCGTNCGDQYQTVTQKCFNYATRTGDQCSASGTTSWPSYCGYKYCPAS